MTLYWKSPMKALCALTAWSLLWLTMSSAASAQYALLYRKAPVEKKFKPQDVMRLTSDGEPKDLRDSIYLDQVPPAFTVVDSRKNFDKRTAAAIRVIAGAPVGNYEDYGTTLLASFAYQDYFDDPSNSFLYRSEAVQSLKRAEAGEIGTNGDYDVLLQFYVTLVYRYYDDLASITCDPISGTCGAGNVNLADHIVNDLLSVRGPLDPHESEYERCHVIVSLCSIPETENHLLMIETARYLTNQLLYSRTHDPKYDDRRNGNGNDPQATAVWLLSALRGILISDFTEYNSRPYQDFVMLALLNLASYSYDGDVQLAARMVMDYISAKVAVSSIDLRRAPPFRRRNEDQHYGPVVNGWLISPLLLPACEYEPDSQGTWFAALAGNTGLVGSSAPKAGPGNFSMAMVFAGLHDYRVPDPILDLFVDPTNRHFYQRLQHRNIIRDTDTTDVADELYSGSPSYLITAGGHPTNYAYEGQVAGFWAGKSPDLGSAMPTTFIPACYYKEQCAEGLSLSAMIQFDHYATYATWAELTPAVPPAGYGYHMCVAIDFACGLSVHLPDWIEHSRTDDPTIVKQSLWTFVDRGHVGVATPGYYLAIYRDEEQGFAFLEAYDTWLHPGLTFYQFRTQVLAANGGFADGSTNTYVTQSGQRIEVQGNSFLDRSEVISLSSVPPFRGQFAAGDVINSEQGSGVITIWNSGFGGQSIKLDMSDVSHPTRTSELGNTETAEDSDPRHHVVWVNFDPNVPHGTGGDFYRPFQTLAEAQQAVLSPGVINILPGSTVEPNLALGGKRITLKSFRTGALIR
jgi:hypothetical protein